MKERGVQRVLVVGASGMLGRPVVRALRQAGLEVSALSRHPERTRATLPPDVTLVRGDLADPESLRAAVSDVDAVYLNLSTLRAGAPFRVEQDGVANLLAVLPSTSVVVAKISGFGASIAGDDWPEAREKAAGDELLRTSGHPWLVFQPTWFMEAIPLSVRGPFASAIGGVRYSPRWLAASDYGSLVAAALLDPSCHNSDLPVEGPEPVAVTEATRRFLRACGRRARVLPTPLWAFRVAGGAVPFFRQLVRVVEMTNRVGPGPHMSLPAGLPVPSSRIEDYAAEILRTGDWPQKSLF